MPIWTDIRESRSTMVRELHDWWTSHHADGEIPDRSMLHPEDIRRLLPNIIMAEVEPEPFRVRYRLVGTRAVALTGFDFTGHYLDDLQPEDLEGVPWEDYYRGVIATRAPLLGSVTVPATAGGTFFYEFGMFPLRRGGPEVVEFIAVEDYFNFTLTSAQWNR